MNATITQSKGVATSYDGRGAVAVFRARVLASGLRMYAKSGMLIARNARPADMLRMAGELTGQKYKRGAYAEAAAGVDAWISEQINSGAVKLVNK